MALQGPEADQRGAESDVSMALGAAFIGTLVLIELVGVDPHSEVLALLAVITGIAFVFEALSSREQSRSSADRR